MSRAAQWCKTPSPVFPSQPPWQEHVALRALLPTPLLCRMAASPLHTLRPAHPPPATPCSLRGNNLTAACFSTGDLGRALPALTRLVAVDLRENVLALAVPGHLAAVATVLLRLRGLCSLGLCGNWDEQDRAR